MSTKELTRSLAALYLATDASIADDVMLKVNNVVRDLTQRAEAAEARRREIDDEAFGYAEQIEVLRAERDGLRTEVQRLRTLVERAFQEGQDGRILDSHEQFIYDVAWEHSDAFKALAVQP